ncbi:MAG: hypothetical protein ACTSX8_07305 [Alphaproteobacteria bacterium]
MKYHAYDYDKQCWITGEPARLLRIQQLTEELELLESDPGYARAINAPADAVDRCRAALARAKVWR